MDRQWINLTEDRARGIAALRAAGVPAVFSDAVRVALPEYTLLYISGMVGTDEHGRVVGPTMKEQTRRVLEKLGAVLAHEGGTFDDVVRVRVYVTRLDADTLREIHEVRAQFFRPGRYPASTLVRVAQLVPEGGLIEIDADAVIPASR